MGSPLFESMMPLFCGKVNQATAELLRQRAYLDGIVVLILSHGCVDDSDLSVLYTAFYRHKLVVIFWLLFDDESVDLLKFEVYQINAELTPSQNIRKVFNMEVWHRLDICAAAIDLFEVFNMSYFLCLSIIEHVARHVIV